MWTLHQHLHSLNMTIRKWIFGRHYGRMVAVLALARTYKEALQDIPSSAVILDNLELALNDEPVSPPDELRSLILDLHTLECDCSLTSPIANTNQPITLALWLRNQMTGRISVKQLADASTVSIRTITLILDDERLIDTEIAYLLGRALAISPHVLLHIQQRASLWAYKNNKVSRLRLARATRIPTRAH